MQTPDSLFHSLDGKPHFRGLPVRLRTVHLPKLSFEIAELTEPADLLDQQDYARRFIEEDRAPYGLQVWPAAIMLAEYILRNEPGEGRSAIELGCGLCVVSMAACSAGWQVVATDNEPTSLAFAEYNVRRNDVRLAGLRPLDWNAPHEERRFDRVFAADVLYQAVDHVPVLRCVDVLLSPGGVALVADPNRGVADRFALAAEDFGFRVSVVAVHAPDVDGQRIDGRVFVLSVAP